MKKTPGSQSAFFNTSLLVGLFLLAGVFVVFFTASADSRRVPGDGSLSVHNDFTRSGRQFTLPNCVQARTFARVTPNGISIENVAASGTPRHSEATTTLTRPEGPTLGPLGNTLWQVDDDNAIADGVLSMPMTSGAHGLFRVPASVPTRFSAMARLTLSSRRLVKAIQVSPLPRAPIAWHSWNRMRQETISGSLL